MLTESQQAAVDTVLRAREQSRNLVIIDGPAGTGKTTTIASLKQQLATESVVYAPTNAAARRLMIKGLNEAMTFFKGEFVSRTEFSQQYRELENKVYDALMEQPPDAEKVARLRAARDALKVKKRLGFTHISEFEGEEELSPGMTAKLERSRKSVAIIDESSMVTMNYLDTMLRSNRLVVMVGDEFQLPPVQGRNVYADFEPTVVLTHVHRHDGPILQLAQQIRESQDFDIKPFKRKDVDGERLGRLIVEGDAMIVAWKNDTVDLWNERIRGKMGFEGDDPVVGERLISRSNAGDLLNNEIVTVVDVDGGQLLVRNEFGQEVTIEDYQMVPSRVPQDTEAQNLFSFGYCITANRAQGNEWKHILVIDQRAGMRRVMGERDMRRWFYTAITRAQSNLFIM